ncbi:MAG: hypothetical protein XD92_0227 [Proteiniphilum acetatigenes]|uniref:Metallo-beta-lactamase domain-containing protein n=1 Tax=Proteiniphilum acetatigenes TaxID=294710 RepID=A0A117M137_9BACT|nr:MAG: hypothetical protein XD92_0227 [Proteiniphilum acetatigenes]
MKIKTFEFNPLRVNTYILSDETKECVVIDAACYYADEQELLLNYLLDHDFVVKHLINTHLHFDHIFGVNLLANRFGLPLRYHRDDDYLLEDIPSQLQLFGFPGINSDFRPINGEYLQEGERITFGNSSLQVIHVPGHSPGSVAFYEAEAAVVISGDALFYSSIGRTDLPRGNYETLINSIRHKLYTLPGETVVYPGHGPSTSIAFEKRHNPFVNMNESERNN